MPYMFTPPQQAQIETLYQAGPVAAETNGDFAEMYRYIATVLSTGNPPPDSDPDVLKARLWFEGATRANAGEGTFSILIRQYTQSQGLLHYGEKFQAGVGPEGMQEASNEVARSVHETLVTSGWITPNIHRIADDDADAVGQTLFSRNKQDTAFTRNAAWSGAVLYSMFGGDQTWRWVGPETAPVVDTLDDYRNLVFARLAYEGAFKASLVYAPWQMIHDQTWSVFLEDMQVFAETCWMSGRFFETACQPTFAAMVEGTVVEGAYASVGMSLPSARTLALLKSGYSGEVVAPGEPGDLGAAYRFFRTIGISGQAASTEIHTPNQLYADAQGSGASANEARQALAALSPFVIAGGGSPAPGAGVVYMSPEHLADRRDMLAARLRFDGKALGYQQSLSDYSVLRGATYTDVESGITLAVDNPVMSFTPYQVRFGSAGADTLSGGDADDRLYGGADNDQLHAEDGDDYLEGGSGHDTYVLVGSGSPVFNSEDVVFDVDGQGSVQLNGVVLSGGDRSGANVWESANGRMRYARSMSHEGMNLHVADLDTGDSVVIRDFVSGDLGIALADAAQTEPDTETIAPPDNTSNGWRDVYNPGSSLGDLVDAGKQIDNIWTYGGDDVIHAGSGNDRMLSGHGADWVEGDDGEDYMLAGPIQNGDAAVRAADMDRVAGGAGADLVSTGVGDDTVYAATSTDSINTGGSNAQGDWLVAGKGNDQAFGSHEQDFISAGAGRDLVRAGASDDVVLGDGAYGFHMAGVTIAYGNDLPGYAAKHEWDAGSAAWTTETSGFLPDHQYIILALTPFSHRQWTLGRDGDDFTFVPGATRPAGQFKRVAAGGAGDALYGGPGADWLGGQTGGDSLFGGEHDDILFGDDATALPAGSAAGDDDVHGGAGDDRLFGNGGADQLHGDAGADRLVGDDAGQNNSDTLYGGDGSDSLDGKGGDDVLYGEAGNDTEVRGGAGADVVYGGAGDDNMSGDGAGNAGNDVLVGGAGNDVMAGNGGDDHLHGGLGLDALDGGAGKDILDASAGGDDLNGGAGDDKYRFLGFEASAGGAATTTIRDAGGSNRIVFGRFIFPATVTLTVDGADLLVQYLGVYGARIVGGAGGGVIQEYEFADGRVFTHAQMLTGAGLAHASPQTFSRVTAVSSGNDYVKGTAGPDTLATLAGDDVIVGGAGDDTLDGGPDADVIDGGPGLDQVSGGFGDDRLYGSSAHDTLDGASGIDVLHGGADDDSLHGGADGDDLHGGPGNDHLLGEGGVDQLSGDAGIDTLEGGLAADVYRFEQNDDPVSGTVIVDGGSNTIRFGVGIGPGDVRLEVAPDGTTLIVHYKASTVAVPQGTMGGVIDRFEFSGHAPLSFVEMQNYNYIFADGFE